MTDVCIATTDPLKKPLSPGRGDDQHPPTTADLTDPSRCCEARPGLIQDIKDPAEEAKAAAARAPARVKRATGGPTDVLRALENRHRWLLFAQHCYTCSRNEDHCDLGKLCTYGKKTLKHVAHCKKEECQYPRCRLLKPLLQHSRRCQSPTCAICVPVWNYIQKDTLQVQQPPVQQQQQHQHQPSAVTGPGNGAAGPPGGTAAAHMGGGAVGTGTHMGTGRDNAGGSLSPAVGNAHGAPAHAALAAPPRPEVVSAVQQRADKVEGGASTSGGGGSGSNVPAVRPGGPSAATPEVDGRLSTTGVVATPGIAVGGSSGSRGDPGIGKLMIADRSEGPSAQASDARDGRVVQRHGAGATTAVAAAPAGSTGASAPPSLASQRFVSAAAPSNTLQPPYGLPPYAGALSAPPTASGVGGVISLESTSERVAKGITITATPAQPIPVSNRTVAQPPTVVTGQPQLVHSYPPAASSIGAFFSHISAHHPHHGPPTSSNPATAAVAAHWLPLQGLTGLPGVGTPAGASPGPGVNGNGGGGGAGGGGAGAPTAAVWANPASLRSAPVAVYGIPPDAVRAPNGISTAVAAAPAGLTGMERFGHPYTIASVNGAGGMPAPGTTLTMTAGPLLLWPTGHPPTAAAGTPPPGAVAGNPGAPMSIATHLAGPFSVGPAAAPGARMSAGAPSLAIGGGPPAAGAGLPPASALVQTPQIPTHALLYGHPQLAPGPGGPVGGGSGSGGGPPGANPGHEVANGAGLWSYVLR